MKKFCIMIIALVLSVAMFAGCNSGAGNSSELNGDQNFDYVVKGNGGSAVQYGDYLYFINGTRGYDDTEGNANVEGDVIKGALYRAKLCGQAEGEDFRIVRDSDSGIKLESTKGTNYLNQEINVVDVELVTSKTIGTSGYDKGGLFIYGEYIYFASPCNAKDRDGNVMYEYNEFFRTNLKTGNTQSLYVSTTKNKDEAYAFYKYNGKIYINFVETDEFDSIMSIEINEKTGKVEKQAKIADKVGQVVFPVKDVYYDGIDTNTVYDFIYYGGFGTNIDSYRSDNTMTFARPDGSESTMFSSGSDATLIGIDGGMVFYNKLYGNTSTIMATDMHIYFMGTHKDANGTEVRNSSTYYEANKSKQYNGAFTTDLVVLDADKVADATSIDCFVPGIGVDSNAVYVVIGTENASDSSLTDLTLYTPDGGIVALASGSGAQMLGATTDKIYYSFTNTNVYLYENNFAGTNQVEIYNNLTAATFMLDIEAEHLIFFGKVDDAFDGYALFYDIYGLEGVNKPFFVGQRKADEISSNVGSIKLNVEEAKDTYTVGDALDVSNVTLTSYTYADVDGNVSVIAENVAVTADMVTGFDSSVAADTLTLTVTYEGKTATYEVSVIEGSNEDNDQSGSCATVAVTPIDFIGGMGLMVLAMGAVLFMKKRASQRA